MVLFVLQNNSFDRIGRLITPCLDYCRDRGLPFVDRSLTAELDIDAWDLDETSGLLVYGSVGWVKRFKESRYSQWIDYEPDTFAASTWVPILGKAAFNGDGWLSSAREVAERLGADGERLHVRPDNDDKAFAGALYSREEWNRMLLGRSRLLGKDLSSVLCWVSRPQEIAAEVRCWIVGGDVVGASYYRRGGSHFIEQVEDRGLLETCRELASLYLPARNVVMDIALSGSDHFVLEYNPIHSSGWYAVNVHDVLDCWIADIQANLFHRASSVVPLVKQD